MTPDVWRRRSPPVFLFVTVFVDMIATASWYPCCHPRGSALPAVPTPARFLYAAMQFAGGPFLGGLSDRLGRRPVLLLCLLGTSLAYLLLGLAQTLATSSSPSSWQALRAARWRQPRPGSPTARRRRTGRGDWA